MGKRKKIAIISVSAALLIILSTLLVAKNILGAKIMNIFDEMYYSKPYSDNLFGTKTSFSNVPEVSRSASQLLSLVDNTYRGGYEQKYLNPQESLQYTVDYNDKSISFSFAIGYSDDFSIAFWAEYNTVDKTLTLDPIVLVTTKYEDEGIHIIKKEYVESALLEANLSYSDIEQIKQYYLYDKFVADWMAGNRSKSKFSIDDLGEYTVIDNTYSELGENWKK